MLTPLERCTGSCFEGELGEAVRDGAVQWSWACGLEMAMAQTTISSRPSRRKQPESTERCCL